MKILKPQSATEEYWRSVEHKWLIKIPTGNLEDEKKSIDDILKEGKLDSDLVFRMMEQLITRVHSLSEVSQTYFQQRMEQLYPDAVKRYEIYLAEQKKKAEEKTNKD